VDGALELLGKTFLIECKAERNPIGLKDVDALYGKISRRASSVLGLFISLSGFSTDVAKSVAEYPQKAILLLTKNDIELVMQLKFSFEALLQERLRKQELQRLVINEYDQGYGPGPAAAKKLGNKNVVKDSE
jgi:hypothetical protein